jgi:hypothetical protein
MNPTSLLSHSVRLGDLPWQEHHLSQFTVAAAASYTSSRSHAKRIIVARRRYGSSILFHLTVIACLDATQDLRNSRRTVAHAHTMAQRIRAAHTHTGRLLAYV